MLLSFFPLFLLQACGGGAIVLKSSDGSEISFKKENVFCERGTWNEGDLVEIECTANGVRTDLTNRQYPFSEQDLCLIIEKKGRFSDKDTRETMSENTFVCSAAKEFGMLEIFE